MRNFKEQRTTASAATNLCKLVVMLLAVTAVLPGRAAAQGSVGRIAFDLCYLFLDEPVCDVSLLAADGSKGAFIGDGFTPAVSPDGSRIAIVGLRQPGLFVHNLADWSLAKVSDVGEGPAWSPDGTRLAFSNGELYVMNADGSSVVQITNNVGFRGQPAWSRDGRTIAFNCEVESGNRDICAINADGTSFRRLTFEPGFEMQATYLPDGSSIGFNSQRFGIAVMNLDGTGVTPTGARGSTHAWSPDGSQIVFVISYSGACDLYGFCPDSIAVMNRDGTDVRLIGHGNAPSWGGSVRPIAVFVALLCNGQDCVFDGSGSWQGNSPIMSYTWDFGDGTTGSAPTANHTYLDRGTYRVTLTVTDESGATATQSQYVNVVGNLWPIPRFTYECIGWRCTFDGSGSSDPDGSIVNYAWSLGEGGASGSGPTVTHTYNAPGPFTVTLSVRDNGGVNRSTSQVITLIANARPVASFTTACTALMCTFDASSSSDADGMITDYRWSFGDGTTTTGVTANHTYSRLGSYLVALVVTDNVGATNSHATGLVVSQPVHIGDLDGGSTNQQSNWTALVTITVHDMNHGPLANLTVNGFWSVGGTGACTTDGNGQCVVSKPNIARRTKSVRFTINSVTGPFYLYTSVDNHDPDGDSNGISLTVNNP